MRLRMPRTETYVIGLLEEVLGPRDRVRRFEWALGDPSPTTGIRVRLPFDAVSESCKLIVEVDEDQHREATPIFDKPHKLTVSGGHRGEQRKRYDVLKRVAAEAKGYKVVRIAWSRKSRPQPGDKEKIIAELRRAGALE
jgi:very-short-patch-repair endonuclease